MVYVTEALDQTTKKSQGTVSLAPTWSQPCTAKHNYKKERAVLRQLRRYYFHRNARTPVIINYSAAGKQVPKTTDAADLTLLKRIDELHD